MTAVSSLPLAHHLRPHRLGNPLDIRHLEDARCHQNNLTAANQVAAAETEIDRAPCNACLAFDPLAEPRAAHELSAERDRWVWPADSGGMARAGTHHHV